MKVNVTDNNFHTVFTKIISKNRYRWSQIKQSKVYVFVMAGRRNCCSQRSVVCSILTEYDVRNHLSLQIEKDVVIRITV